MRKMPFFILAVLLFTLHTIIHSGRDGVILSAQTVYHGITEECGGLQMSFLYTDNMILQRNTPLHIGGMANAGEKVTVTIDEQQISTLTPDNGKWHVTLNPLRAGNDYTLTISTLKKKLVYRDVAVGEVWLCSGQSNMALPLHQTFGADSLISNAANPHIRLFNMKARQETNATEWSLSVLDSVNDFNYYLATTWQPCTPESATRFSAVAYNFGKMIYDSLHIPVGLICNAVGGSTTESWINRSSLEHEFLLILHDWLKNDLIQPWVRERAIQNISKTKNPLQHHPYEPGYLFDAGILPLERFAIRGVIWYQGESNTHNIELHAKLFKLLIRNWRKNWDNAEMPFYFVQLSSTDRPSWTWFRDSQRRLQTEIPYTGMAVSSDLGDSLDVHPRQKKQIGDRLARLALYETYEMKQVVPSGPLFRKAEIKDSMIYVSFDFGEGLHSSNKKTIATFEVAEYPWQFFPAITKVEGNTIKVSSSDVKNPRYVRYGWQPFTRANLVNNAGLPASTFTTVQNTISNLLPQPQSVCWGIDNPFLLSSPSVNLQEVEISTVDKIPQASINENEAYRLSISEEKILIEAITEQGVYWAKQTLKQLVSQDEKGIYYLPACEIIDYPAFRIRGFMHDVGRSFISTEELKKQIALLSQYKINVFHWHLTENQGWRLESKRYPQLNDSSSFSRLTGQYYTIEDAREIADWCAQHNMLLIPEIDMPGHSAAFVRAMDVEMQSEEGMEILKHLMDEICTDLFPDVPYIHIGTDEVQFTNPEFVPQMVEYIRSLGKMVISWNPGWNYKPGEIDMTQLWSYRSKAQPGIPAVDSRFHYINHFDLFGDIVALYNSRIYDKEMGSDDIAGSILAVWNDRTLPSETDILLQNNFYPSILAFAERTWIGGGSEYFDGNGVILPTNENEVVFRSFTDFERRMLWHKEHVFAGEPFPYVKQTNVKWLITDPFPNNGNLSTPFPPEESIENSYLYEGKNYQTHPATGAGIYLRHVWGNLVPAFFDNPQENHTAYAYTWVYSPKPQNAGLWIEFQNYGRSESDLPPPAGKWDYKESRIWLNDTEIVAPEWTNTHTERSNEIALGNENLTARPPVPVHLEKGWNKVFLKLPVGKFTQPEIRLVKWMFTAVFVTTNGQKELEGLIYSPEKQK